MAANGKPLASLSLDLDNLWSYMKTHGDPGWEDFPSYLDLVVPRVLDFLKERDLTITFFIVGQDAALAKNHAALRAICEHGHEVGNHSFRHEPWLQLYTDDELETEIARAEDAIAEATGERPTGFRGPGFSVSESVLRVLKRRGYRFDASTFPTFLGPLARTYYFFTAKLTPEQREERKTTVRRISRRIAKHRRLPVAACEGALTEVPVTTMPVVKLPFHFSYLIYLAGFSPALARLYFRTALAVCRMFGVQPSMLLHPLDFLGKDDLDALGFFPGMSVSADVKLGWMNDFLAEYKRHFEVVAMGRHVNAIEQARTLRLVEPRFEKPEAASAARIRIAVAPPPGRPASAGLACNRIWRNLFRDRIKFPHAPLTALQITFM